VHCGKGCDRTGLVIMLLLSLVGASPEEIAADYEMTAERLRSTVAKRLDRADHNSLIDEVLEQEGASLTSAIVETLASVPIFQCLRDGGLTDGDVTALRQRLVHP
jgi:protein-tyrosine phosphatase